MNRPFDHDELVALLVLDRLPRVGPRTVKRLVERFGSGRGALAAPTRAFERLAGPDACSLRSDPETRREAERLLEGAASAGAEVWSWTDDRYPDRLRQLADPPPILFVSGRTALAEGGGVAIVGARRASGRSRDVSRRLGRALARAGVPVWSGLALGVDAAAHQGALEQGGDTIAVLGSGIDVPYPRQNRALFGSIRSRGLLVSEFAPGTSAAPWAFPRRNRVIAALADAVVVVSAGRRSGALITVDHALDIGRDVWAVPGPVDEAGHRGSNQLLADGAKPLVSLEDFAHRFRRHDGVRPTRAGDEQSDEGRLLDALAEGAMTIDELVARVALPAGVALAILTTLELHGDVERLPDARYRAAA